MRVLLGVSVGRGTINLTSKLNANIYTNWHYSHFHPEGEDITTTKNETKLHA
jgi:hypothetical protein